MSCGNPHKTSCAEVLDRVYEFIDGEIDGAKRHAIKEHLDECGPCLQEFGLEEQVKAIVKRSCSDPAPPDLRAKVLAHLEAARSQLRTEI